MAIANTYATKTTPVPADQVNIMDSAASDAIKKATVASIQKAGRNTAASPTLTTSYANLVTGVAAGDIWAVTVTDANNHTASFILGVGVQQSVALYINVSALANCGTLANPSFDVVTLTPAGFAGNIALKFTGSAVQVARTTGSNYATSFTLQKLN